MEGLNKEKVDGNIDDPEADRFCFADQMEFVIYAGHCKKLGQTKNVIWENKSTYQDLFMQGYRLFEDRKFRKAIEAYQKALKVNPVGINARFEICECYLQIGNLLGARSALLDMQEYLVEAKNIARFYRRMGYIAIEQKDYRLATACFIFSMRYEKSNLVADELMYIHSITGGIEPIGNPEEYLRSSGIPILTSNAISSMKS